MRARETPNLGRWREASRTAVQASLESADLFTEFLVAGGPDAIKSLKQTIRKLQQQLKEIDADKRLERYRKLQKDLEECHQVRDSLRDALLSFWTDDQIDAHLNKRLFKASTLYGASRELLLQENRILRAQLEEHLVTSRTSRASGPPAPSRATVPESKLKQGRMMQGPHMENVARLIEAAEALDRAERGYQLPSVAHAEVQADDGSRRYISTLEQQLSTLAGQKLQLMQQVAAMTEQNRVLDMKLEGALDQVSELRRQKTEMLAHQENLSADLREHLLSEAKRADTAETALAEAKMVAAEARQAEEAARTQMERAMAEAQAMQAALQEKAEQVDTLRGLYLELREALEKLAGDVTAGQQEAARRVLDATTQQLEQHGALLGEVKVAVDDTCRATQHHSATVTDLTAQQAALAAEVARSGQAAALTLDAYERQMVATQQMLERSDAERVRLTRQALAASALARIEDKKHENAVKRVLQEVPPNVARQLVPKLEALEEGTLKIAEEVAKAKNTLVDAGITAGGAGTRPGMLHPPMVPDEVDDATTQLLAESKQCRAKLLARLAGLAPHSLKSGDDGRPPASSLRGLEPSGNDSGRGGGGSEFPLPLPLKLEFVASPVGVMGQPPGPVSPPLHPGFGPHAAPPGLLAGAVVLPAPPRLALVVGPGPDGRRTIPPGALMVPHAHVIPPGTFPGAPPPPGVVPPGPVLSGPHGFGAPPGPYPGFLPRGVPPAPVVIGGGPPGRMDLVLHLKRSGAGTPKDAKPEHPQPVEMPDQILGQQQQKLLERQQLLHEEAQQLNQRQQELQTQQQQLQQQEQRLQLQQQQFMQQQQQLQQQLQRPVPQPQPAPSPGPITLSDPLSNGNASGGGGGTMDPTAAAVAAVAAVASLRGGAGAAAPAGTTQAVPAGTVSAGAVPAAAAGDGRAGELQTGGGTQLPPERLANQTAVDTRGEDAPVAPGNMDPNAAVAAAVAAVAALRGGAGAAAPAGPAPAVSLGTAPAVTVPDNAATATDDGLVVQLPPGVGRTVWTPSIALLEATRRRGPEL